MLDKISQLRTHMQQHNLAAYIVPMADKYHCEYVPAESKRLEWLTGFTGSSGLAVITQHTAAFFTDGRYTLQAKSELPKDYSLYDSGDTAYEPWLAQQLKPNDVVGVDADLLTMRGYARLEKALSAAQITLRATENLIDKIWQRDAVAPNQPAFFLPERYTGQTSAEKIALVVSHLKEKKADAVLLAAVDSVNWLLNVRGHDLPHTPFILSFAVVHKNGDVEWLVDETKITEALRAQLPKSVRICHPEAKPKDLFGKMLRDAQHDKLTILIDPSLTSQGWKRTLSDAGATLVESDDPCQLPKACKNAMEIEAIRQAHITDGKALTAFLQWLENEIEKGVTLTELDVVEKLRQFRAQGEGFFSLSFDTIAGSGPNGAIIHYRATEKTNRTLQKGELFLLDSGAQYWGGTTDVTRTIAVGTPTAQQKHHFTLVLKGHIAMARAVFPKGTTGSTLDVLARQFLWQHGLDYAHGTGHGVGAMLNVHEGPQRISKMPNNVALQPGMVLSNEPGFYLEGQYGIRIENLVVVQQAAQKDFYCFETLTRAPIDMKLVDETLLSEEEKDWLTSYHQSLGITH